MRIDACHFVTVTIMINSRLTNSADTSSEDVIYRFLSQDCLIQGNKQDLEPAMSIRCVSRLVKSNR